VATLTQLRSDLSLVADLAAGEVAALWGLAQSPREAEEALRDVIPGTIAAYGSAAATVGADWYDEARDEAGAAGRFRAVVATPGDSDPQRLVSWALGEARDMGGFQSLIVGGTQRRITNFARATISRSSIADPAARGWKRVGIGQCDFCRMLIGRGAVYTEETADFHAHDHCNCSPAPAWA
jgi:hypothetical protein